MLFLKDVMEQKWRFRQVKLILLFWLCQSLILCWSLNDEGLALLKVRERVESDPYGALRSWRKDEGVISPCSWFGVECSNGHVVVLNLKDLCLRGTLAPELRHLTLIKSILLRNNSLSGPIPEGLGVLKELEVLDFGYNNFSGPLPPDLGSNLSLAILLLDNNGLLSSLSLEIYELGIISEAQVDENQLSHAAGISSSDKEKITRNDDPKEVSVHKRILQSPTIASTHPVPKEPLPLSRNNSFYRVRPSPPSVNISSAPSPVEQNATSPSVDSSTRHNVSASAPAPSSSVFPASSSSSNKKAIIVGGTLGSVFILLVAVGIFIFGTNKTTVKPWATGLSGQLQKAFVTGVPKLKRSELQAACEDFSNVLSSSPVGTLYKGTLSSGVEIVVVSVAVKSNKDWSKSLEMQFRNKVEALSKVNHKNFVNLLGFCEDEEPFTRMLVFEYAPNGTLFEHLHFKESEHLNWGMRLRIAMGMAYCLDHMHQLNPPRLLHNLNSSSVYLTEDYAAKIFDFSFSVQPFDVPKACPEANVYSFGVLLFEMVTGRLPYSVESASFENWASHSLTGYRPLKEMVDPTLDSFEEEKLERIGEVIKSCVHPDPKQRPAMREVTERLREVIQITPDSAIPKLSPLWWAELEILSAEGG